MVQPAPLAAERNGPIQQGAQQRVVVLAAPDQRPGVQRHRSGHRDLADPGIRGHRDLSGAYLNHNIGVFTVRDGKIASVREYTDTQRAERILFAAR